jgi:hypothetical protein
LDSSPKKEKWGWYVLLLVPFVATLWVPFYNKLEPAVGGVPFFYWYLFLWIAIGALLTGIVYFATRESR